MLEPRREKALRAMVGVLFVFGSALIYFLFFNSGLELYQHPTLPDEKVIVSNVSVHAIRDIVVSYVKNNEKVDFFRISVLAPGQLEEVSLSPEFVWGAKFVIQASAPFHLGKQIVMDARRWDPARANLTFSFRYPEKGFVGNPVESVIEACNQDNFLIQLVADVQIEDSSFANNPPSQEWVVPPFSCQSVSISFVPKQASSTLSFKIRVFTPSSVISERTFSIPIQNASEGGE